MDESDKMFDAHRAERDEFALGDELRGERATLGKSLLDVQRDLRIKAAYIAAIENTDPGVFPNPAFVPGYVRSYARYLNLDPDEVYARFCRQSGFSGGPAATGISNTARSAAAQSAGGFRPDFPLAQTRGLALPDIPVSAIGSLLVLVALLAGLGYGGWTVLQNIQRVQFAPVEEVPLATVAVDALEAPEAGNFEEPTLSELASPVAAMSLADLYRQQELEVPILVPRDGPIAAINPEGFGPLAGRGDKLGQEKLPDLLETASATLVSTGSALVPDGSTIEADAPEPQVTATAARPQVTILAERAAWIRVYLENGTVIFERILERGESYTPPEDLAAPLIWAGNSGSVYVQVGDSLRGPLGSGTRAVRDVALEPQALTERYVAVAEVPEALTETLSPREQVEATAAIQ